MEIYRQLDVAVNGICHQGDMLQWDVSVNGLCHDGMCAVGSLSSSPEKKCQSM